MDEVWQKAAIAIKKGSIVVIPTDTIYGIVVSAFNKKAVERLYRIRVRNPKKPCIILCASVNDFSKLGVVLDVFDKKVLSEIWPNPVSVILPCRKKSMTYLHRGTNALAVRIPKSKKLLGFLKKTGPIIAPSANLENSLPANSVVEAKKYFGDKVDVYVRGRISKKPSTLVSLVDGKLKVIREGAFRVSSKIQKTISKKLKITNSKF